MRVVQKIRVPWNMFYQFYPEICHIPPIKHPLTLLSSAVVSSGWGWCFPMWISDCFNTPLESNPNPPFQEAIETISYILGLSLLARIM